MKNVFQYLLLTLLFVACAKGQTLNDVMNNSKNMAQDAANTVEETADKAVKNTKKAYKNAQGK